jgi:hypothetical protein
MSIYVRAPNRVFPRQYDLSMCAVVQIVATARERTLYVAAASGIGLVSRIGKWIAAAKRHSAISANHIQS